MDIAVFLNLFSLRQNYIVACKCGTFIDYLAFSNLNDYKKREREREI